jgi:glycosyltransferase involved in cell wall biosynthesis
MILIISSVFPPEPVVSATVGNDLAIALSENREVKVITPRPTRPMGYSFGSEIIENKKFEHIVLNSFTCPESRLIGRIRESYSFGRHSARYIKKNHSVIKCIFVHAWPLLAQYLIAKTAKRYSIPYIIHIVDIYPEAGLRKVPILRNLFFRLLLPIDKYVQKNSSRVITISNGMKDLLVKTRDLAETKVDVVNNWQNEELFIKIKNSITYEHKNSHFTFMYLGNLTSTAAINILIAAFNTSKLDTSRLVIAGDGSEKENLKQFADSLHCKTIEFWEAPMMKVPELQNNADVLLISLKKGVAKIALPSKLPAYMFSGKPIIACADEESDTANAIKQANCGWIIAPENIVALAETMKRVASIPKEELLSYGRNGFNYALKHFSKKKNLQKMTAIIDEITETK